MVDAIVNYINSVDPVRPEQPAEAQRQIARKVLYALCNSLGSIFLVYEGSRRMLRKANVFNQRDVHLTNPIAYLNRIASEAGPTVTINGSATVQLMYCHRTVVKLGSHCCQLLLLGSPTVIVFADHRTGSEEAQQEHAQRCSCGHMCHSNPPTYALRPGDRIALNSGNFSVSASSEKHCIYMSKSEFLGQITFHSAAGTEAIKAFVNSLPDTAKPMVS